MTRRRNPYADLSALLDSKLKLTHEEMAELQLELGYTARALLIYEQLLLRDPQNTLYRRRCEWLARVPVASEKSVPRPRARPPRSRVTTRRGSHAGTQAPATKRASAVNAAVRPLEIITVGR